ncbi:unnamed protein product [Ilex paraguariensis]|uniref:Uncharacterized protein n=1 Tax=Ilex paraguariensis TaxID=185542 RepID=A0ABC8T4Y4_9AQUA
MTTRKKGGDGSGDVLGGTSSPSDSLGYVKYGGRSIGGDASHLLQVGGASCREGEPSCSVQEDGAYGAGLDGDSSVAGFGDAPSVEPDLDGLDSESSLDSRRPGVGLGNLGLHTQPSDARHSLRLAEDGRPHPRVLGSGALYTSNVVGGFLGKTNEGEVSDALGCAQAGGAPSLMSSNGEPDSQLVGIGAKERGVECIGDTFV